ncbi:MAG: NUMOD4 motif-containing HNH endonuclease [Aestuariivirga sp.]
MSEIWKDVVGFEGAYQVSNLGRVRSLDHRVRLVSRGVETTRLSPGKILRPGTSKKSGHQSVLLGRGNSRPVHQLVLEAFVGPRPEGCIDTLHEDHDPSNNKLDNIRWGTRSENLKMDYEVGTRKVQPNFNRWGHRYG